MKRLPTEDFKQSIIVLDLVSSQIGSVGDHLFESSQNRIASFEKRCNPIFFNNVILLETLKLDAGVLTYEISKMLYCYSAFNAIFGMVF